MDWITYKIKAAEELQRRKEQDRIKTDVEYFIENYVYIEDRDSAELAVLFHLWQGQKTALEAFKNERLNIVLKARQLGLTWLTLAFAVWNMLFNTGYMIVALSKKDDDAKELVRRAGFILRHMPEWLTRHKRDSAGWQGMTWEDTTSTITIHFPNGEDSTFKSFTAAPDSGRSFTANLVILDEWAFQQWAREIWTAAYPTINRPTGGKLIGLSTIERGSLFEDIWIGDNNFNKIFLGWDTDPRRTQAWYEQTKKDLGDATLAEYPATEEEAFMIPGGAFFGEIRSNIHIKEPDIIEPYYNRYVCIDYGLDMLAAYWIYINNRGRARVYRELYKSGLIVSQAAEEILKNNQGEKIYQYIAPPDLWNRNRDTGKSTAQLFQEHGIYLMQASNDFEQGCLNMKEWLRPIQEPDEHTGNIITTANLTIDEGTAPNLWKSLLNIQKDEKRPNVYAKTPHDLTHAPDSIRYFTAGRPIPAQIPQPRPNRQNTFETYEEERNEVITW
ncbi:MAG: hypothetical protein PHE51_12695 [Eubacteriales bacterium]|nr:hypothetical protein [Eubacteriales bacterium]